MKAIKNMSVLAGIAAVAAGAAGAAAQPSEGWHQSARTVEIQTQRTPVAGKIARVDLLGRAVTLDDGTRLVLAGGLPVADEFLVPGADVKARYEVRGGQRVATAMQVTRIHVAP